MKKIAMLIAIIGTIALAGCGSGDGSFFGSTEKLSAKELARRRAAAVHGNNKPYTYTWTEETVDGFILMGKAIVVPD